MGTDLSPYFSLQSRKASAESHVKVGKIWRKFNDKGLRIQVNLGGSGHKV
jgi:hypothetical protein